MADEVRGPFEPLVSSADGRPQATPAPEDHESPGAEADPGALAAVPQPGEPVDADLGQDDDPVHTHAAKLEQIKDLYLTAEAIGEDNVEKHFDTLLAQQRELISEYFKQTGVRKAAGTSDGEDSAAVPDPGGEAEPVS